MKKFIELSKILTKYRLKKIDVLSLKPNIKDKKYLDISLGMANGTITTFEEMAHRIGMDFKSNTFHVFKSRFFEKLLNSLLFLDLEKRKSSRYTKAIAFCNRNIHCFRLLLLISARQAAISIAFKTLKTAQEYELADSIVHSARYIRTHYSLMGDVQNFNTYNEILKKYIKILNAEDTAAEYFESLNVMVVNSSSSESKYLSISKKHLEEVLVLRKSYPSYQMGLYYYRLKAMTEFFLTKLFPSGNDLD